MKVTNREIWETRGPLQTLLSLRLPIMVGYRLAEVMHKLSQQLAVVEEVRQGLVKRYGTPVEGGLSVPPLGDSYQEFMKEFDEILAVEVELSIQKVKLPQKVAATCDECHHNMDRPLEIEVGILLALINFVEVVE